MKRRRRWRDDRGVAAVELAILLPVFLALAMATVDFALAFREQIMLRNAASNAASYAEVQPCDSTNIRQRALDEFSGVNVLKPADADVTVLPTFPNGGDCSTGTKVQVTVTAPYHLLTGTVLGLFGVPQTLTVTGQETVQVQGRPA